MASGDDVLCAVLSLKPSLVIMDIHLRSYVDGIDAATRLRLLSDVPVIYVTAYPAQSVLERAMRTHPADYLEKPIDEDRLRASVDRALGSLQTA